MIPKTDLEETIKEKVLPLLEQSMEKNLGVYIPKVEQDISDKLMNSLLQVYVPFDLPFPKAKKIFKKEFLKKELKLHLGNISQLAKSLDLDRRSIHRAIKEFGIDVTTLREEEESQQKFVDETIRETLNHYKDIIRPEKIQKMYEEVPALSRNIAKLIQHPELTWKQMEREFEKQFLEHALKEQNWNVRTTAKKIDIRMETLHRKIKILGLKK